MAIDGYRIVVGAPEEESNATTINGDQTNNSLLCGAAYVFERTGTNWAQTTYLKNPVPTLWDAFGYSVSVEIFPNSLALDQGDPALTSTALPKFYSAAWVNNVYSADQRRSPFARIYNGRVDKGALEFDPTVPSLVELAMKTFTRVPGGEVTLEFWSQPGTEYFLDYTDDLSEGFTRAPGSLTATGAVSSFTDVGPPETPSVPSAAPTRFYRISNEP